MDAADRWDLRCIPAYSVRSGAALQSRSGGTVSELNRAAAILISSP
jgi:hypothetical protein